MNKYILLLLLASQSLIAQQSKITPTQINGVIPISGGGTGASTFTSGKMLKGNGTDSILAATNIRENGDTVVVEKMFNVDTSTFFVQADSNRVGILTSSPGHTLHINRNVTDTIRALLIGDTPTYPDRNSIVEIGGTHEMNTNGTAFSYTPTKKNTNTSSAFYGFGINPNIDLQQNLFNYFNFVSIQTVKTNGYTLTDLSNAFYRNDFFSSTGTVTNSVVVDVVPPYFYTSAIKPTNNTGFRIRNQGASGITTSYGLYIDSQSGATNSYPIYIGGLVDGDLKITSGIVGSSSDQRLKNEDGFIENGLEKINQLIPRYYYWKDKKMNENRQLGFFAQEVNAIIPEAAPYTSNSNYYGLYSSSILAVAVKAIQEQQTIIEDQATVIETLKTQITNQSQLIQQQDDKIQTLETQILLILQEIDNLKK